MAQQIEKFQARRRLYPWDEWADGNKWRVKRHIDFQVTAESMASQIRTRAYGRKQGINCRVVDEDTVEFQFLGKSQRERDREFLDSLRKIVGEEAA